MYSENIGIFGFVRKRVTLEKFKTNTALILERNCTKLFTFDNFTTTSFQDFLQRST